MPVQSAADLIRDTEPYLERLAHAFCCMPELRQDLVDLTKEAGLDWLLQGGDPDHLKQQLFISMHRQFSEMLGAVAASQDRDAAP